MDFFGGDRVWAHVSHFEPRVSPRKEFFCRQSRNAISRELGLLGLVAIFAESRGLQQLDFLPGDGMSGACSGRQELAPVPSRVALA